MAGFPNAVKTSIDHITGVNTALGGEEWSQTVRKCGIDHTFGAAFGNVCNLRAGDTQKVECKSHRFAVEVSAGDDVFIVQENKRVVGNGIELDGYFFFYIFDCIADCTMYLWNAAQGISILYAINYLTTF